MIQLQIPDTQFYIREGDLVKLERFDNLTWEVHHGWFSFGGNRPFCGWYLSCNDGDEYIEKPLQLTDLDDIYVIEKNASSSCCEGC